MKIGVVSDSHGNDYTLKQSIENMIAANVDVIFHLGDNYYDSQLIELMTNIPLYRIGGNTDFGKGDEEVLTTIDGVKVLACHGHKQRVKNGIENIYYYALEKEVDLVLFGHTHKILWEEYDGIIFVNPGSIGHPKGNDPFSYCIIETKENELLVGFYEV
jgi:hypothetical protein